MEPSTPDLNLNLRTYDSRRSCHAMSGFFFEIKGAVLLMAESCGSPKLP